MAEVRLTTRSSRDGKLFTYVLDYRDDSSKRRRISLGHADLQRAQQQRRQMERQLQTGLAADPTAIGPQKLTRFWQDSQKRTRGQIRQSSTTEQDIAMRHLIEAVGDIDVEDVRLEHGERFVQACLDRGNTPATASKKIKGLKRVFQLAVHRGQIDTNPFKYLSSPKLNQQDIHIYSDQECRQIIKAAGQHRRDNDINWELLVSMALCTGMRRGELLNLVWADIDFERQTARVAPKPDGETWPWLIKDAERRTLPLTDALVSMLLDHQERQPEGYPYALVPPNRCDRIQERRRLSQWGLSEGRCPINNFKARFDGILRRAGISRGTFHDLRRTCITRWFENGLSEFDIMKLAGHSDFATTHRFYLAVRRDLLERARQATTAAMAGDLVTRLARAPHSVSTSSEMGS